MINIFRPSVIAISELEQQKATKFCQRNFKLQVPFCPTCLKMNILTSILLLRLFFKGQEQDKIVHNKPVTLLKHILKNPFHCTGTPNKLHPSFAIDILRIVIFWNS